VPEDEEVPMTELGKLLPIDLRQVWPKEARDFTPWLAENLAALGDALGMDLELSQVEASVGAFALDILAREVNTNRKVAVENQLETTDHDHLGKLLTYSSGHDADIAVWISRDLREEHRQALDWLNQRTDTNTEFYGVVVETFRIDESRPAFRFNVVARPNQWRKTKVDGGGGRTSDRQEAYRAFFQDIIDLLREQHRFTNARIGQAQSWYIFASGVKGIGYSASFGQGGRVIADIYIDIGSQEVNKGLFDLLLSRRGELELAFGEPLDWRRLENRRASRIGVFREGSIDDSPEVLEDIRHWLVERLLRLKEVFNSPLSEAVRDPAVLDAAATSQVGHPSLEDGTA
jgi:hypothetical protein